MTSPSTDASTDASTGPSADAAAGAQPPLQPLSKAALAPAARRAVPAGDDRIRVSDVRMRFVLRHNRSLKELAVAAVRGKDLSNSFMALDGIDLSIGSGETVALLGHNGSGKSTLLKVISGVMQPTSGRVRVRGRIAGLIEVGAGFHPDLTGRENVYLNGAILGMDEATIRDRFDDIVAFSEIERFIDTEVKHYSSGMFLRLAFAVAVHTEPEIFLVDEILAVGDEPFQKKCLARIGELQAEGRTLVIVSHDLDQMAKLATRAVVLDHGSMVYAGDPAEAVRRMREGFASR